MDMRWKAMLWSQFGASVEMLENAIRACPNDLWDKSHDPYSFWYLAYHTVFFLDYYSSGTETGFQPLSPFTLSELDPSGVLPDRVYSKEELLVYLQHGKAISKAAIAALTNEDMGRRCGFTRIDITVAELFLYNMRHLQHHTAQLNLLLRQSGIAPPSWVSKAAQ